MPPIYRGRGRPHLIPVQPGPRNRPGNDAPERDGTDLSSTIMNEDPTHAAPARVEVWLMVCAPAGRRPKSRIAAPVIRGYSDPR